MLYLFKFLILLINVNETILCNWFNLGELNHPKDFSFNLLGETLQLILNDLKVHEGLSLTNIEGILIFILFLRFLILAFRYNIKTSVYITCIGIVAGYLWYRHLIDLITMYQTMLLNIPFLENLGLDANKLQEYVYQVSGTSKIESIHWYDIGSLIFFSIVKGIKSVDPNTGLKYYIDPLSMIVSNLNQSIQTTILPIYYQFYNQIIPKIITTCTNSWNQLSSIAAYALITRIGKRYCPYLIRWHWTFLLIISVLEPFVEYFIFRAEFFQEFVLIPRLNRIESNGNFADINNFNFDSSLNVSLDSYRYTLFQVDCLNTLMSSIILIHISLILFALFHAIWGQYFYLPFLTENVELHIGLRPKSSIYSGGQTAWQDPLEKEQKVNRFLPNLWYGWFGHGTKKTKTFISSIQMWIKQLTSNIWKYF